MLHRSRLSVAFLDVLFPGADAVQQLAAHVCRAGLARGFVETNTCRFLTEVRLRLSAHSIPHARTCHEVTLVARIYVNFCGELRAVRQHDLRNLRAALLHRLYADAITHLNVSFLEHLEIGPLSDAGLEEILRLRRAVELSKALIKLICKPVDSPREHVLALSRIDTARAESTDMLSRLNEQHLGAFPSGHYGCRDAAWHSGIDDNVGRVGG